MLKSLVGRRCGIRCWGELAFLWLIPLAYLPLVEALAAIEAWNYPVNILRSYIFTYELPLSRFQPSILSFSSPSGSALPMPHQRSPQQSTFRGQRTAGSWKRLFCSLQQCLPFFTQLSMAIDSPLLRQKEQENFLIAARLKQKRLKIKAGIAEIERGTIQLFAGNSKLLSMLCVALAFELTTADALVIPSR
jgi:hypothetical protein